ncbi:hypothetical protein HQQ81_13425 [Microbacteriaceae bacterium VKM Ac-2854]|nr:hypothetical protein [Microbacteriaceae bacterium VKM Ac-2854]
MTSQSRYRSIAFAAAGALILGGVAFGAIAAADATTADPDVHLSPTDPPVSGSAEETRELRREFGPLTPLKDRSDWVTEDQVVQAMRGVASTTDGSPLSDAARSTIPVQALLTTYGRVTGAVPELGGDPDIASDRPVWVATAHAFLPDAGHSKSEEEGWNGEGPVTERAQVYSMLFDASSGDVITIGNGADVFAMGMDALE